MRIAAPAHAAATGLMEAGTYYWHFVDVVWVVLFVVDLPAVTEAARGAVDAAVERPPTLAPHVLG